MAASPSPLDPPPLPTLSPPSTLPNATSNPPTSSNPSAPTPISLSPPPSRTPISPPPPSPTGPILPPPAMPPIVSPPPPSISSPPPASSSSPPPIVSPSPPPVTTPPPVSASPPPPILSPPPPSVTTPPPVSASPPPPILPPPPPSVTTPPPVSASPPPPIVSPSPPSVTTPPPVSTSPAPPRVSPPPPSVTTPPPVSAPPPLPISSPPPPPRDTPPLPPPIFSPPPPTVPPPPPLPPPQSPPDPASPAPPTNPPENPSLPPPSPVPPSNSPSTPSSPPPPRISSAPPPANSTTLAPPQPFPLNPPSSPTPTKSSNSTPNATLPSGNVKSDGSGGVKTGSVVVIVAVAVFVVLSLVGILVCFIYKRKKRRTTIGGGDYGIPSLYGSSPPADSSHLKAPPSSDPLVKKGSGGSGYPYSPSEPGGLGNSRSWFTYEELLQTTDGFSEQNLLGEGGFGPVYKGHLPDGREVAVKQLKVGGSQGEREFRAEVEIISRIHHRHLVSLVGYCICEDQRLLVYDYVPNNTLHYHLHGEGSQVMPWTTRVRVAAGAARGIAYLHEDCQPRIIHRDIKSSNILLDNNFDAQVSDFGLAKLALDSFTHVSTRVMGTFGYLAPEYASSGKLTEKSDVYSFGVVLLELVTGRKPVDISQPLGDESLVEWARPLLTEALNKEDFDALVDPRLEKNYVQMEVFGMIEAAAACIRHSSAKRPRMGQVVRALDSMAELLDLNNGMKPGESELFISAEQSAQIRMFRRMGFGSQDYSSTDLSQSSARVDRDQ